jgi:hypothetical protein
MPVRTCALQLFEGRVVFPESAIAHRLADDSSQCMANCPQLDLPNRPTRRACNVDPACNAIDSGDIYLGVVPSRCRQDVGTVAAFASGWRLNMKTARWIAVPGLISATWLALTAGTLIQFAALGGSLAQIDGAPQDDDLQENVVIHTTSGAR